MKVLILGGYGAMAQSTVPDLLESPGVQRVGIAGRNLDKAKAFANVWKDDRAVPLKLDARDNDALKREFENWDCVINSAWYDLNVPIMETAIKAGIHYIDLGGLYHQTLRQYKLDKQAKDAGVTCILGIGSTPGTMNVMGMYGASKLEKVHKMILRSSGITVEGGEPGKFVVPYAVRTIFDEFSMDAPILRDGKIADRRIWPAIDVLRSSTRKEELLLDKEELNKIYLLRNFLADMPPVEAIEFLLERMKRTKNNKEFFASMQQG